MARSAVKSTMKILVILVFAQVVICQSTQKSLTDRKKKKDAGSQNPEKLPELFEEKLQSNLFNFKSGSSVKKTKNFNDLKNSSRKPKSLTLFPFFSFPAPVGVPPEYFYPPNKEVAENSYPGEWLSRTEPFKKNPLVDSPTYYIRLPPNPYIFAPGLGYVSRPPVLSDPEVLESEKAEQGNQVGANFQQPFYKVPINFVSNGKPTSVYQLSDGQTIPKPDSSLVNLTKGPYVFNGKPNEIYLIAQIYDALYGDELAHFYP